MTLYSYNGAYPQTLPFRIRLSDGRTRTDPTSFTAEKIADAGYTEVSDMPTISESQILDWDGTNWVVRDPNESETAERWEWIKLECERRLFETDYKVIKAFELSEPLDPVYTQYRQELRDLYNNVNNIDPWNFSFPSIVTEEVEDPATNDI